MNVFVMIAHHSIYGSALEWDEFAGVFDSADAAQAATDAERVDWIESTDGYWFTPDFAVGADVRRSFKLRAVALNSIMPLFGDKDMRGVAP